MLSHQTGDPLNQPCRFRVLVVYMVFLEENETNISITSFDLNGKRGYANLHPLTEQIPGEIKANGLDVQYLFCMTAVSTKGYRGKLTTHLVDNFVTCPWEVRRSGSGMMLPNPTQTVVTLYPETRELRSPCTFSVSANIQVRGQG